jgi:CheY-like chemotaxis protein
VTPIRVLLADDEPLVRSGLRAILESEPDMTVVGEADDGAAVSRWCGGGRGRWRAGRRSAGARRTTAARRLPGAAWARRG